MAVLERLQRLAEVSSLPWIVVGDFNEIVSNTEKEGGGGGVRCCLDRVVANPSWFDTFPVARVLHIPVGVFVDDQPRRLITSLSLTEDRCQNNRFRFESSWTNLEACKAVIEEEWASAQSGVPMHQMVQKITKTQMTLNVWQRSTFRNRKREIELIRYRLRELFHLPLSDVHQSEYAELSGKLEVLLEEEHAYWKQRAKVQWLSDGDKNTKFFHRKASNRRAKNRLQGLFDNGGVWRLTTEGMETVIVDYFQSMYASATLDENHMHSVVDILQPRVTTDMNGKLCAEYSDNEIRAALFQMYTTKSPGPNGMPPEFFQKYWDTIGNDVCVAVKNFLQTGVLLKAVNYTHVCLIPKVANPTQVSDLLPIALCDRCSL
ncbi:hypothetical protein ACLB2K_047376 [Fragaria x ananassa]